MKPDFLDYIRKNVVLADGALGSYLYELGAEMGKNLDLLNITRPDLVFSAHEEYVRAGSQLIETNTFGANRFMLHAADSGETVQTINRAGAQIAVKAAGRQVYVAGSIGPTGVPFPLELGDVTPTELHAAFSEQVAGLGEGGVDLLILETFSYLDELLIAIKSAQQTRPDLPIVAQMVYPTRAMTQEGLDAAFCADKLLQAGAAIVGANCGRGVDATLDAIRRMSTVQHDNLILSAFPNAGLPEMIGHRMLYPAQPSYMATRASEMIRLGVHLIGGCCGTTPAYIHEFRKTLPIRKIHKKSVVFHGGDNALPSAAAITGQKTVGAFLPKLQPDRLPIIVEVDPPHHLDIDQVVEGAGTLAAAGVDAISLGDSPLAILRTGNMGLARIIQDKVGLPAIIHQTGRDMNSLALQARMMEAHLLGINAVLAVTGDSAAGSDQPNVSGVFDLDSFGLIRMLDRLNQGVNLAGQPLRKKTRFSIGAAFSFRAKKPAMQISRLEKKVALGACFAMTQPLFSKEEVEMMMEMVGHCNILIFPGIFPLLSSRNAEFLHNEVPGISVPAAIRSRLAKYQAVEDQRRAAMEITRRLIDDIAPFIDGLYLISPLNKWEIALDFVTQVRQAGYEGNGRHQTLMAS